MSEHSYLPFSVISIFVSARRKGKKKRDPVSDSPRDGLMSSSCLLLQCYIYLSEGLAMVNFTPLSIHIQLLDNVSYSLLPSLQMLAALRYECKAFQAPSIFNSEQEVFSTSLFLIEREILYM